jgi:glutamate dehydrogenase
MGQCFFTSQYLYGSNHKYINQVFTQAKEFEENHRLKRFAEIFLEHYPMSEMNEEQISNLIFHIKNAHEFFSKNFTGAISIRTYSPDFITDDHRETIIEIHTKDMPFLVDSVLAEVKRLGLGVYKGIYPMFSTERSDSGELKDFECAYEKKGESEKRESFIHLHITYQKDDFFLANIKERLFKILQNVHLAVEDWREMTVKLQKARDNSILEASNSILLSFSSFSNFTFLI